jgi:uncharacterized membrane protein YfcA
VDPAAVASGPRPTALHALDPIWLTLAGFGAGLTGSVAGLASLVSYPSLLALGIPPVAANVTNTVALLFTGVGAIAGSRPELRGQRRRARSLGLAALSGGLAGALLLLVTPPSTFSRLVPWLIGLSSLALLARRAPRSGPAAAPGGAEGSNRADHATALLEAAPVSPRLGAGVFLVAIYGGFFGAGAGVIVLALLLVMAPDALPRSVALKNLLVALSNLAAAVTFAAFGPVRWWAVLPLAVGGLAGGRLGPVVVRHVPAGLLRAAIACAGIGLAAHLGLDAYR